MIWNEELVEDVTLEIGDIIDEGANHSLLILYCH